MRRWEERLKKVEGLAQEFLQTPLTTPYRPRLWSRQPSSVWRLFPRQSPALSFTHACREDVHLFALEKDEAAPGHRIYLVTSYSELWHYYRTYQRSLMHCYEVIPEGAVCKLYFDLEFHRPSNQGLDGEAMTARLIQHVCEQLKDVYAVACSARDVLNLDSSTEDKFSRHLIFCEGRAVFTDNVHMGRFVRAILSPAPNASETSDSDAPNEVLRSPGLAPAGSAQEAENPQDPGAKRLRPEHSRSLSDLSWLRVKGQRGQDGLFIDLGVYTKNRNFRLYKSSKMGGNVVLTLAEDNQFSPRTLKNVSPEQSVFMASLVCNVRYAGQRVLSWDAAGDAGTRSSLRRAEQHAPGNTPCSALGGAAHSPYREVDAFVLALVQRDHVQGGIRRWDYFVVEQLLVYSIVNYRWCENVGRFHKSNNIMILVDLKEEVWYQKCHDPACRTFRSSSYPLPQEICVSHLLRKDEEEEEEERYVMDAAGTIRLREAPGPAPHSASPQPGTVLHDGGDGADDQAYLEALEDYEQSAGFEEAGLEPDQVLLDFMTQFDSP